MACSARVSTRCQIPFFGKIGRSGFPFRFLTPENARQWRLPDIQVSVVGKAGERYLLIAGHVEAKLACAQVRAWLRPAV